MHRDRINRSSEPSVEYLQIPDEPISFSLGDASARRVYPAPSLWHLALAHPRRVQAAPVSATRESFHVLLPVATEGCGG